MLCVCAAHTYYTSQYAYTCTSLYVYTHITHDYMHVGTHFLHTYYTWLYVCKTALHIPHTLHAFLLNSSIKCISGYVSYVLPLSVIELLYHYTHTHTYIHTHICMIRGSSLSHVPYAYDSLSHIPYAIAATSITYVWYVVPLWVMSPVIGCCGNSIGDIYDTILPLSAQRIRSRAPNTLTMPWQLLEYDVATTPVRRCNHSSTTLQLIDCYLPLTTLLLPTAAATPWERRHRTTLPLPTFFLRSASFWRFTFAPPIVCTAVKPVPCRTSSATCQSSHELESDS